MSRWPRRYPPSPPGGAPRPLEGLSIILTRPAGTAEASAETLAAAGAEVLEAPAIEFAGLIEENLNPCRHLLSALAAREGWLILPSPTAIRFFGELIERIGLKPGDLAGLRLAVIGRASAGKLKESGFEPQFQPPEPTGASLAETLPAEPGTPVVIAGSSQSRPELPAGLARRGLNPQALPLYAPQVCPEGLAAIAQALAERPDRVLVVTSPSAVDAMDQFINPENEFFNTARWVAIGPTTMRRLTGKGINPEHAAQAETPTAEGLLEAVRQVTGK